jgi:hypothetical protein
MGLPENVQKIVVGEHGGIVVDLDCFRVISESMVGWSV